MREFCVVVRAGSPAPTRAETHFRDGPRRQSFRKSDAHPWRRANLNLHRARWRIFNPVALSARTPPHRPSVGDYQLHRHLAGSACNFMGVCLRRYRRVCRLHLFQQPLLRLGPARRQRQQERLARGNLRRWNSHRALFRGHRR